MLHASDPIAASLEIQIADYRELYELLVAEAQRVESGNHDTLPACCEQMRQVMERIDRSSTIPPEGAPAPSRGVRSSQQADGADSQGTGSGHLHRHGGSRSRRTDSDDGDPVRSRLLQIRKLIGQIESLRAGIVRGLCQAQKDLAQEMNQLTAGAEAAKGYYKPRSYRGARYFDRSQ